MSSRVGERVAEYVEAHRTSMLDDWMKKVIADPEDPYKDFIRMNGSHMLDVVIASARGVEVDRDLLRRFAHQVADERLKSNTNIGDFVYNVALGRSEVFNQMPEIDVSVHDLYPVFGAFNALFDEFLHLAVHRYTELKNQQLEEKSYFIEQSHKDRLTILGQMSSSFVHEFRNPLTAVIGFVQLLKQKHPSLEYIDVLMKELNDLKFRITQFLLISKKGIESRDDKELFPLGVTLDETLDFLYPMIVNSNVEVERNVEESLQILGHRDEFRQVLINIIMNSLDALSSCSVRKIRLLGYRHEEQIVIAISNNGPRIPDDMMETIFEPFVSSKELGTGIGLYLCKKIISDHNGYIECQSDDHETSFRIVVPLQHAASVAVNSDESSG